MYLWKVDSLVDDFRNGRVTQKEELKYLMVFTVLTIAVMDPAMYIGYAYTGLDTVATVLMIAISVFGLVRCYKINEEGDGRNFLTRAICLGLPVVVRVIAVFIPFFVVAVFLEAATLSESIEYDDYSITVPQVAMSALFLASYYWYLGKKIGATASVNA